MEIKANACFEEYVKLYFDVAYSSVYFFNVEFDGFGATYLVKKLQDGVNGIDEGCWDSIHTVTVSVEKNRAKYRVTTTCFLSVNSKSEEIGKMDISGSLTKTKEDTKSLEG